LMTISTVVSEDVIREKTRDCIDHLVTLFDSPPPEIPAAHTAQPVETTLDRILNP